MRLTHSFVTGLLIAVASACDSPSRPQPDSPARPALPAQAIRWEKWSDDVFDRARTQHKFVLLDLEAVWCHWCHVMDDITYADPKVAQLIASQYIAVRVDQDSRPDISQRYEDYGWPATVVFDLKGGEIVKRQGYIPPGPMASMLQAIIDDPTPGPSIRPQTTITFGNDTALSPQLRQTLQARLDSNYDLKQAGWGTIHKSLDCNAIEYSLLRARAGDKQAGVRARQTLDAALKLIDPAWGGIYQYSTDGDWIHPHFEKIMEYQAGAIRMYAIAWSQFHDPAYLKASRDVAKYLATFLTGSEGAFYTSQDADLIAGEHSGEYFSLNDSARRKLGIPRVDTHIYSRENGWAIDAMLTLYDVAQDSSDLAIARRAADWIIANRSLESRGFRHDESDPAGPYLSDTLAMGQAFLHLYASTADRMWLTRAQSAADFIESRFHGSSNQPGFITAIPPSNSPFKPLASIDENIVVVQFLDLLSHYANRPADHVAAQDAMKFLATPSIAQSRGPWTAGTLLADLQLAQDPLHITILGPKNDSSAAALFAEARKTALGPKRIEWLDLNEGTLPNPDVAYPRLNHAAAFLCTGTTCSTPMTRPEQLAQKLARLDAQ